MGCCIENLNLFQELLQKKEIQYRSQEFNLRDEVRFCISLFNSQLISQKIFLELKYTSNF